DNHRHEREVELKTLSLDMDIARKISYPAKKAKLDHNADNKEQSANE
ncbi:MAG: hypothetical protein ACI9ON_002395, partial [Limisphaerales bacterium]